MQTRDDNPLRDAQDESPVSTCQRCRGEVYRFETLFKFEGRWICVDCLREIISDLLEHSPTQMAQLLQFDTIST